MIFATDCVQGVDDMINFWTNKSFDDASIILKGKHMIGGIVFNKLIF